MAKDKKNKRKKRMPKGYWNDPKNVDNTFDALVETLRRVPTVEEIPSGALNTILKEKYNPAVRTYNGYLRHYGFNTGCKMPQWDQKTIDNAFDDLVETMRRVPTAREMLEKSPGALQVIRKGKYLPNIKTYGDYLKHWGFK